MSTEYGRWVKFGESFLLVVVAPFLLFPHYSIFATTIALIIVIGLWLWPILLLRSPLIPGTPYNATLVVFFLWSWLESLLQPIRA